MDDGRNNPAQNNNGPIVSWPAKDSQISPESMPMMPNSAEILAFEKPVITRWQPPTTTTTPKPFSKNHQQQFKKQHSQIRKQKTTKRVHFNEHASVIVFNHLC